MSVSHIQRIKKNLLNNSTNEGKAHLKSFSRTTNNRLDHFITPISEENQQDIVIINVASHDIIHNTINNIDAKKTSQCILDIGNKEVISSSIFIKRQFKRTRIMR